MLGKFGSFRHFVVGTVVAGAGLLGATGVIGGGHHDEVIDHWQVVISPAGGEGLRIRETFDQDFGTSDRRGPERTIPNDFGVVTDVTASSPDAPDDLNVENFGSYTRIRVGDPDTTLNGQHRYVIEYTLPAANLSSGLLAVDALGDDYRIDMTEAEVIINGFELSNPECFFGPFGSTDPCTIETVGEMVGTRMYRATIAPLPAGSGITVRGVIEGGGEAPAVPLPPIPERRDEPNNGLVGLGLAGLGAAVAAPIYVSSRRKGRNEVFAGGAADAAFGELPAPGSMSSPDSGRTTVLVVDDKLADLATIEFVPPPGIEPWEAAVLLSERIDDSTTQAYVSGLVGKEILVVEESGKNLSIGSGPKRSTAAAGEAAVANAILALGDPYTTGKYDPEFAAAWASISTQQQERIASSRWWKRGGPGGGLSGGAAAGYGGLFGIVAIGAVGLVAMSGSVGSAFDALDRLPLAAIVVALVSALVALGAYSSMLPARSAQGSALALRTESFRRFLHASEGQHVEWAWNNNLLREYSAWAVALGEAEAWSKALERANIPEPARLSATPLIIYSAASSINSSRTAPSSSGSSGGGGGGGFSGGGGGGGGGGSW